MAGELGPERIETVVGRAEVKDVFSAGKHGKAAGLPVTDGFIRKALKARITRDDVIVYNGEIASLRRFKDDVAEVRAGRPEEITSELQPPMRISYAVFCMKKKKTHIVCSLKMNTHDSNNTKRI